MNQTFNDFIDLVNDEAAANNIPVNGTFELTPRCNLHCKVCYLCNPSRGVGEELSGAQWLDIMEQARNAGMVFALLTGGEALLHKDFWDIYLGLKKLGVYVSLNSNGTAITPEVADMLKKYPPIRVAISVYGSSPEAYQKVCGSAAGFEKTIRGVELLRDCGIEVRLRTILTRDTAEDIENIARLILSYDVPFIYGNYVLPPLWDNGNDPCSLRLNGEELIKYTNIAKNAINEYYTAHGNPREQAIAEMREEMRLAKEKPESAERRELHRCAEEARNKTAFKCQAGLARFSVSHDGFIRLCEITRDSMFDLKEIPFIEAFKMLAEAAAAIPDCTECIDCPDKEKCSPCPPRHFIETGSYLKKAEYVCAYTKAGIELFE